ncbi:MAG TPA: hypothetical protein VLM81_02445 [Peptostreptococcaceae bacterium]|nr:hypothetical protein [Peptostreptococcaceae bacterium]
MAKNKLAKRDENPFINMRIKDIRFLEEYMKSGNKTQAWMKTHNSKNNASAYFMANQFLKKHKDAERMLLEQHGITMARVAEAIDTGLKAESHQVSKGEVYTFVDPYARMKAAEIAHKLISDAPVGTNVGNQLNVQINTTDGGFKVVEG